MQGGEVMTSREAPLTRYLADTTVVRGTLRTSGSEAAFVVQGGVTGAIVSATIAANTNVLANGSGATLTLGNGDVISGGAHPHTG